MSEQDQEYQLKIKNSILLPKTDFPMRGQLPKSEPLRIESWTQQKIYQKMVEKNSLDNKFIMPDGPPYANGDIHVGHVLNKVLKDIVMKYKNMQGFYAAFIPGWDCHGLPIELKVTKGLGAKKKEMSPKDIRALCRKEALKWVDIQKEQFIRLGVLADWEHPYLTLQPEYEAEEIRVLAKILEKGHLYRGEKPVNWCPTLQTALAAAEVEYQDHKSPSVYVKFPVQENLSQFGFDSTPDKPVCFVIWTTTPWTLPANRGICLNENLDYGVYDSGSEYLVLAQALKESVEKDCQLELTLVHSYKGSHFEKLYARHPFLEINSLIILGDHVTTEAGTGCVHTAPGHGLDDYHVGMKYGLEVASPVDPAGKFTDQVPQYAGISIWDGNKVIVEDLKKSGHLLGYKEITHSYPHNPRSNTPLIFRATPQWFIQMDKEPDSLRKQALEIVETKLEFTPSWGKQRLVAMVQNSPDWCISRQRSWGVPIPVFYCSSCHAPFTSVEVMNKVADAMDQKGEGIEAFYNRPAQDFTGDHQCETCGHEEFEAGTDILDVWFDSGVCHTAVQKKRPELGFPADIYLEGSDQHRGWFQTSLMSSVAAYGSAPYKALITHGFVNDADGYKMSKSKGNVIDPAKVFQQYGAEILRLWVAYEDYGQDLTVGDEIFKRISETYRRIRNTLRFLLGNLSDFNPSQDKVKYQDMPALDQWALGRLSRLIIRCTESYEAYNFYKVYHSLNQFFTVDLSSIYLDILKDRLYTAKQDGIERRSSQTVILELLNTLTRLMAPILSFIAEEAYEYTPGKSQESVFLEGFPQPHPEWHNPELEEKFEPILAIRSEVTKKLETLRNEKVIGSSLEAAIELTVPEKEYSILKEFEPQLCEYFIVSQMQLIKGSELLVKAQKADGEKCIRCWNYSTRLGENENWPQICPKCVTALS